MEIPAMVNNSFCKETCVFCGAWFRARKVFLYVKEYYGKRPSAVCFLCFEAAEYGEARLEDEEYDDYLREMYIRSLANLPKEPLTLPDRKEVAKEMGYSPTGWYALPP